MMKASTIVLLAAIFVLLGRWAKGQTVDARIIIGGLFAALIISMMDSADPKLARGFAWLFFASAALTYLDPILKGVDTSPSKKATVPNLGQPNIIAGPGASIRDKVKS